MIVDGEILAQTGPFGYYVYVQGSSSGVVEVNGDVQEPYRFQVQSGTAEVNGSVTTTLGPYVSSGSSTRLSGTGTFSWTSTSQKAEIYGNLNPGTSTSTGILTLGNTWFRSASSSNFEVELNGTTAGSGYDQLVVNGTVELAGDLEVTLVSSFATVGDTFTIIDNDGTDPIVGFFNGLPESGLVEFGGNIWSISYVGGTGNDVVLTTSTVNQFPTADAQSVSTNEETALNITLTGSDTDGLIDFFSIETNPTNGSLSGTAPNLTYTPFSNFAGSDSFDFRVTDDDGGFSTATISITVNNTQDAPTQVNLSNSSLNENTPSNTTVGTLTTVDPDVGDTFTYTLVAGSGDSDNSSFTIVGDELRSSFSPDFETKDSYSVRVKSTDAAGDSVQRAFTITINDVNEIPTALSLSSTAVDENVAASTVVGAFSTTDPDAGDSHTYSLVTGTGDTDNGSFTIDGSQLKIAVVPDFETKSSYDIRVRTTDSGSLSIERTFTITINDLNDQPIIGISDLTAESPIDENEFASLSGTIDDNDASDTFTMDLNWGDGNTNSIFLGTTSLTAANVNGDLVTWNPATYEFEVQHQYLDDGDSPGNGTDSDEYTIAGTVTDSGGTSVPLAIPSDGTPGGGGGLPTVPSTHEIRVVAQGGPLGGQFLKGIATDTVSGDLYVATNSGASGSYSSFDLWRRCTERNDYFYRSLRRN